MSVLNEKKAVINAVKFEKREYNTAVYVTFDDGSEDHLFNYYDDEIHFAESELIGLTAKEALNLFYRKDIEYFQS